MIDDHTLYVTTTGSAGSASGEATTLERLNGLLVAVYLPSGAAATTDWTFSDPVANITLFTLTNYNTPGLYSPLIPGIAIASGVAISGAGVLIPLCGPMKVAVAQGNAGTFLLQFRVQR